MARPRQVARLNPRWRVLLWRSSVAGLVVLAAFLYLPPLMSWSLPSPPASEDRTVHAATTRDAVSLVANGPLVDGGARTELAGDRTARSGPSPRDGHAKSVILPNHTDATTDAVAPARPERDGAGLTWFDLACRSSSYLNLALADLVWRGPARDDRDGYRPWTTCPDPCASHGGPPVGRRSVGASCPRTRPQEGLRNSCDARPNSPCLMGLWRPTILLPAQCEADSRAELPSILAHELAHLKAGDLAWNALFHGLSILLWVHPLVWRVRIAHADACDAVSDAIAADYVGDTSHYARILARLTLRVTSAEITMGLSMARKSDTRRRIEAVQRHVFRDPLSRSRARLPSAAALGTVLLGGLGLERSSASQPRPSRPRRQGVPSTTAKCEETAPVAAREPGVVSGEVVDAESRAAVARAEVLLLGSGIRAPRRMIGPLPLRKDPERELPDPGVQRRPRLPQGTSVRPGNASAGGVRFAPIRLLMRPGKQVKVTVASAATGRPIEGAASQPGLSRWREATTGSDGVAVLRALLPDKYGVAVLADGRPRELKRSTSRIPHSVPSLSLALRHSEVSCWASSRTRTSTRRPGQR